MSDKLRVGAVSYMNTKPLVWELERMDDTIELYFEVPSTLSTMFDNGLLDVALLPAVRYLEDSSYRIIPDISISANGMVESVNLLLKKDISSLQEVALDTSSRTSRILTAIILNKRYSLTPDFIDWDGGVDVDGCNSDAVLLIGDNAMRIEGRKERTLDLGDEWRKLTNLPFVFALWVTKRDTDLRGFDRILQNTKRNGLAALEKIAEFESKRLGFSKEVCLNYLGSSIQYNLGRREIDGLVEFYNLAAEMGLIEQNVHSEQPFIKFYGE